MTKLLRTALWVLLLTLLLNICCTVDLEEIIKSKSDKRTYKAIRLQNQMQCIIISDKQANKSSATISVGVGAFEDPPEAQGLTNALMHMLLMGSTKYPKSNQFGEYISKNSGDYNAFCYEELSSIFFQVPSNAFKGALERLSDLITSPLLAKKSLQKTIQTIESGFSAQKFIDPLRKMFMNKYLSKQDSPFRVFTFGNRQSLSHPNLYQMIKNRFETKFSSNIMKLVVYTNQQLDKAEQIVKQCFQKIPNKRVTLFQLKQMPYPDSTFRQCIKILPIKQMRNLEINWVLKNKQMYYQNHPGSYVSYLLNQQASGSLSSFLIEEGLVEVLSSSHYDEFHTHTKFVVSMQLTKKGVKNYKKVIGFVMFFIKKLLDSSPREWVFKEIKNINTMNFDFKEKGQGPDLTTQLSLAMFKTKISQILIHDYLMNNWNPNLITQFLREMTIDNMFAFLIAQDFEKQCNLEQKYYKIKYRFEKIFDIKPLSYPFVFPPKNSYIPSNFSILPLGRKSLPSLIYSTQQLSVYYKQDHQFGLPKVSFKFRLFFKGNNTIRQFLSRKLFYKMLQQRLRSMTYMGSVGGIQSSITFINCFTCQISMFGFRDSILKFINPFLYILLSFEPTDLQFFQSSKQDLETQLKNSLGPPPFVEALKTAGRAVITGLEPTQQQQLQQLENINYNDVLDYSYNWKQRIFAQCFITGNINPDISRVIIRSLQRELASRSKVLQKSDLGKFKTVKIPPSKSCVSIIQRNVELEKEENCALVVHFQFQAQSFKNTVLQNLINNFVTQFVFNYFRVEQQIAYIVNFGVNNNRGVLGFSLLLQSPTKNGEELSSYVDKFLNERVAQELNKLQKDQFEQLKNSLKIQKSEEYKNLIEQSDSYWTEIKKHSYMFQRKQIQLSAIDQITLDQFKKTFNSIFYENPKRLQIHIHGHQSNNLRVNLQNQYRKDKNIKIFKDIQSFKKQMEFYPDLYAFK